MRTRCSGGIRARRGAIIGVLVLALAACGGDDDIEPGAEADAEPEEVVEPEPETSEPEPEPEVEEEVDDGSGFPSHRPPSDVDALADCAEIVADEPGASIVFPSAEDPTWLDAGDGPVTVEFTGCSNTFEANLVYEIFHGENRNPTLEGHTMGGSMGGWERYTFEETFWTPGAWTLVVLEHDAESGERREYDSVTFEVG